MKAKYHSKYNTVDKNGKGIVMFRYLVSGSDESMAQFKKAQGDFYRENEEGVAMFFTPRYHGDNVSLGVTTKGKVYADTAAFDKLDSLVKQYPGALGQEIAKLGAAQILGDLSRSSNVSTPVASATEKLDA